MPLPEKLDAKLIPFFQQPVPLEDSIQFVGVQNSGFHELQKPGEIFGAARLQGDSRQMLGGDHPGAGPFHIDFDRLLERFLFQRIGGRKKRPGHPSIIKCSLSILCPREVR